MRPPGQQALWQIGNNVAIAGVGSEVRIVVRRLLLLWLLVCMHSLGEALFANALLCLAVGIALVYLLDQVIQARLLHTTTRLVSNRLYLPSATQRQWATAKQAAPLHWLGVVAFRLARSRLDKLHICAA
jgi:hypothetical protein